MSINNWKIYCDTESKYVSGFIDNDDGLPTTCFNNNTHSIDTSKTKLIEKIYTNHTREIIQWKIFCDTEQIYTYGYLDYLTPPEGCFNNNTHVCSQLPIPLDKIYNNNTRVQEEKIETGGNFKVKTLECNIPAGVTGTTYEFDNSFPHPISMVNVFFNTYEHNNCDVLNVDIAPDTLIGVITQDYDVGVTSLCSMTVTDTVIENSMIGGYLSIDNGITSASAGNIINIDKDNFTIDLIDPEQNISFPAGSMVKLTVKMMEDYHLEAGTNRVLLGSVKIGASYVPANTIGRIKYTNNNGLAKRFIFGLEYLY